MKMRTVINKVENGAIVDVTIQMLEENEMIASADCSINNQFADVKIFFENSEHHKSCIKMLEEELKSKGIEFINYI